MRLAREVGAAVSVFTVPERLALDIDTPSRPGRLLSGDAGGTDAEQHRGKLNSAPDSTPLREKWENIGQSRIPQGF